MRYIRPGVRLAGATVLLSSLAVFAVAQDLTLIPAGQGAYAADLTPADEVPAVTNSQGTGHAEVNLDKETLTLSWTIEYSGLTGPATAAHIHGPAAVGENAGPIVNFGAITADLASPIVGSTQITAEQAQQLEDGLWYVNIHTEANPNGEIRGQLMAQSGGVEVPMEGGMQAPPAPSPAM